MRGGPAHVLAYDRGMQRVGNCCGTALAALGLVLLTGCTDGKQERCRRMRAIVTEEMQATTEFGKNAASLDPAAFGTYASALRKANAASRTAQVEDPALRKAVDSYRTATEKLAAAYETQAVALTAHALENAGGAAAAGIIYGPMLDKSRIDIANACP